MDAAGQLDEFIDKYTPEIAAFTRHMLGRMREIVPPCIEMVYDNYNALVIGFCPDEKPSNAIFSVVPMPRWVSVCFLQGAGLPDPHGLLIGEGNVARHIKFHKPEQFERPEVHDLLALAMAAAKKPFPEGQERNLIIKSISAKQRPRRSI
jgi:hypothetical protein